MHLLLLVVYSQRFQEILMFLLLAFKKRLPVNLIGKREREERKEKGSAVRLIAAM